MTQPARTAGPMRRPWEAEAIRTDPLGYLAAERAGAEALAAALERIADELPCIARPAALVTAAARLRRFARILVPMEDACLLDLLEARCGLASPIGAMVGIVRRKGAVLASRSIEVADLLEENARTSAVREAESLGFMLRECFESLRQRAEWLEIAILPETEARLDEACRHALGERLAAAAGAENLGSRAGFVVLAGSRTLPRVRRSLIV